MTRYKKTEHCIIDQDTGKSFPIDPKNRHYRKYQKWVDDGNEPDPDPDIKVQSIDPRIALIDGMKNVNDVKAVLKSLFGL